MADRYHTAIASIANLTSPPAGPDAALIALCAEHAANRAAFNQYGDLGRDDDPLGLAYGRTRDAISSARAQTMAGILAKAAAAKGEARNPDGSYDPEGTPAADWAFGVVNDLLRLHGVVA